MPELVAGLLIFFFIHSIAIVNEEWRNRMAERLGEEIWQSLFGLLAFTGIALIIWGYSQARLDPVVVYSPTLTMRHINLLVMLAFFPLLIAAYAPGKIREFTRHPMLLATIIWAVAHLLSNGTLADLLLFGSFLVWAIAELVSLRYRTPHPIKGLPAPSTRNDAIAILVGLVLYAATLVLTHAWFVGVTPGTW
jgi:uncharacterized membrane protein